MKLTTDRHEALRSLLAATAELLVYICTTNRQSLQSHFIIDLTLVMTSNSCQSSCEIFYNLTSSQAIQSNAPNDKLSGTSKSKTGLKHAKNSNTHNASPTASDGIADWIGTGFGKS